MSRRTVEESGSSRMSNNVVCQDVSNCISLTMNVIKMARIKELHKAVTIFSGSSKRV